MGGGAAASPAKEPGASAVVAPGARAWVHGLQTRPDLNGLEVAVLAWDVAQGRWKVRMGDGTGKLFKPTNLSPHPLPQQSPAPVQQPPMLAQQPPVMVQQEPSKTAGELRQGEGSTVTPSAASVAAAAAVAAPATAAAAPRALLPAPSMKSNLVPGVIDVGARARLRGLKVRDDLNGQEVGVLRWDTAQGRWKVRMADGSAKLFKPENLEPLSHGLDGSQDDVATRQQVPPPPSRPPRRVDEHEEGNKDEENEHWGKGKGKFEELGKGKGKFSEKGKGKEKGKDKGKLEGKGGMAEFGKAKGYKGEKGWFLDKGKGKEFVGSIENMDDDKGKGKLKGKAKGKGKPKGGEEKGKGGEGPDVGLGSGVGAVAAHPTWVDGSGVAGTVVSPHEAGGSVVRSCSAPAPANRHLRPVEDLAIGEIVRGRITSLSRAGALVDFGCEVEGLIPRAIWDTPLQVGQAIPALNVMGVDAEAGKVTLEPLGEEDEEWDRLETDGRGADTEANDGPYADGLYDP